MRLHVHPRVPGLCVTCRHGQVTELKSGRTVTWCTNLMTAPVVQGEVVRCTEYEDRRRDTQFDMEKIAWTIRTNKRGVLGFQPPTKERD